MVKVEVGEVDEASFLERRSFKGEGGAEFDGGGFTEAHREIKSRLRWKVSKAIDRQIARAVGECVSDNA